MLDQREREREREREIEKKNSKRANKVRHVLVLSFYIQPLTFISSK